MISQRQAPFPYLPLLFSKCCYCPCCYSSVISMYVPVMSTQKPCPTADKIKIQVVFRNFYQVEFLKVWHPNYKARFPLLPQISPSIKDRGPEQEFGVTFWVKDTIWCSCSGVLLDMKVLAPQLRGLVRIVGSLGKGQPLGIICMLICNSMGKQPQRTGMEVQTPLGSWRCKRSVTWSTVFEMK